MASQPAYSFHAESHIGSLREENQDAFGSTELPGGFFATVCDGMGGYAGGRLAAQMATDALIAHVKEKFPDTEPEGIPELLKEAVTAANDAVRERARQEAELADMGTTCVCLLAVGDRFYLAHVGDSRAYLFRDAVFSLKTSDHTVVQHYIDLGKLNPIEAANHQSAGILLRCLGQVDQVTPDVSGPHPLADGDRLLLCSDGLSGMLYEDDIAQVTAGAKLEKVTANLIRYANEAGGFDNITVAVFQAGDWPETAAKWKIRVDSPEARALEAAQSKSQHEVGQHAMTTTVIMEALQFDDDDAGTVPHRKVPRSRRTVFLIAGGILMALGALAILLLTR